MVTLTQVAVAVYNEMVILDHKIIPVRPRAQLELSARKWACHELLNDIQDAIDAPFVITPVDLLEDFKKKMDYGACEINERDVKDAYVIGGEVADMFMEELGI